MGDDDLFEELYPALRRFAGAVAPPGVDPDDLLQEAVARTLRHQTLVDLREPDVYLRRVVARLASNHRRDWSRRTAILGRLSPARPLVQVDQYPSDLAELRALPPETRAVLWLRMVERRSYAEIAVILQVKEGALRARASRGLRQLGTELARPETERVVP